MHALVLYESMFGNTQAVAFAVARGLSANLVVDVAEVGAAGPLADPGAATPGGAVFDLVVIGGPTHAFGLSTAGSRRSAAERARGPVVSRRGGLREWLDANGGGLAGLAVATFDTRINRPRLPGSAANVLRRRLRRLGCLVVDAPASFRVASAAGPLVEGELARALAWGERLAAELVATIDPGLRAR